MIAKPLFNENKGADGTYHTASKHKSRRAREQVLLKAQADGKRWLYIELGGMEAGVTAMCAPLCPGITFGIAEMSDKCIASLNQKEHLKRDNIRLPAKPQMLEDYLQSCTEKIGFLDADFRGYASPLTLGIANYIPKACIPEEGTEVWINLYKARGTVGQTGLELDDANRINDMLELEKAPTELTKMAMIAQQAITERNSKKDLVYEFDQSLMYMGNSKGGPDEKTPMFTIRAKVFDRAVHPEKQHKYNYEVDVLTPAYKAQPASIIWPSDVRLTNRIPGGFTQADVRNWAPIIAGYKLTNSDIKTLLGVPDTYIGALNRNLKELHGDTDWRFLKKNGGIKNIDTTAHGLLLIECKMAPQKIMQRLRLTPVDYTKLVELSKTKKFVMGNVPEMAA
jgi:hypothetical protein